MTQSQTLGASSTASTNDLEALAQKVDQATNELQSMPTEMRVKALALKAAVESFHKAGLTQIVKKLKSDPRGKELLFELIDQPEVYALFSMHGLIRADLASQVSRVIEMVRPYMQSHGGDVALVGIRERTVLVRLMGSCSGCSMSQVTLRNTVEEALKQHVPEVDGVEVVNDDPAPALVQLQFANDLGSKGWLEGPNASDVPLDRPIAFQAQGVDIVLVRSAEGFRAYRNACPHQGLPLDGGGLDIESGTLTCPWHGFRFDVGSGECLTAPQCQLEAFPLRIENGRIWVRPE